MDNFCPCFLISFNKKQSKLLVNVNIIYSKNEKILYVHCKNIQTNLISNNIPTNP